MELQSSCAGEVALRVGMRVVNRWRGAWVVHSRGARAAARGHAVRRARGEKNTAYDTARGEKDTGYCTILILVSILVYSE